jgi:hypothetical protein
MGRPQVFDQGDLAAGSAATDRGRDHVNHFPAINATAPGTSDESVWYLSSARLRAVEPNPRQCAPTEPARCAVRFLRDTCSPLLAGFPVRGSGSSCDQPAVSRASEEDRQPATADIDGPGAGSIGGAGVTGGRYPSVSTRPHERASEMRDPFSGVAAAVILSLVAPASVHATIPPSGGRAEVSSLPRLHKGRTAQQRPSITMPETAAPAESMAPDRAEKPPRAARRAKGRVVRREGSAADHMANELNRQELQGCCTEPPH